jgi:integrase
MKLTIRKGNLKNDGTRSLILEKYKGYVNGPDGKNRAIRDRENIPGLFVYDKPRTTDQREHNKKNLLMAEAFMAKIQNEINQGAYKIVDPTKGNQDLIAFFEHIATKEREKMGTSGNWKSALKHLKAYAGDSVPFRMVDVQFCEGFKNHLQKTARTTTGKHLGSSSVASYFVKLRAALRLAVKKGFLLQNPALEVETPRIKETPREYLTQSELQAVAQTPCRYEVLKRAFLFSCLTGMRWSDIVKLQWKDVRKNADGTWQVVFNQRKTDGLQYHFINAQAKDLLGQEMGPQDRIFIGLTYSAYLNTELTRWMVAAGITKHITFHCGRHTYAVLHLSLGGDIYTLSELLGHKELRTTEIYAKIIDQKKIDAANRLPLLQINF